MTTFLPGGGEPFTLLEANSTTDWRLETGGWRLEKGPD